MKRPPAETSPILRLLARFWLLGIVVCTGAGLIAVARLGANLRIVWVGGTALTFAVLLYVADVSYTVRRNAKNLETQLDQVLRKGGRSKSRSNTRPF